MKENLFEVAHELHLAAHVVTHGHERRLSSGTEPADQLVADAQELCKCLAIILLAFDETFEHLALIIRAARRENGQPFDQTDLLETLLHEPEQSRPVALLVLVCRQVQNNL
jgi:hypothetical protein